MDIVCDECGVEIEDDYHRHDGNILCDDCYNDMMDEENEGSNSENLKEEIDKFYWGKKDKTKSLTDEINEFYWGKK